MKQVKGLIGLLMCVVLAAGCLTGCGGKSDATILTSSVKNINSAKNFDVTRKESGKIKGSMAGESIDIDIDEESKGTLFADPFKAKDKITTTTSGASQTLELYLQKEGDKVFCYTNLEERWVKYSVDEDTAMAIFMQKLLPEEASKYTKKDDIEENGKKYLTYECPVAEDFIKNMIRSRTSSTESMMQDENEEKAKMVDDAIKSIGDIKMTILIDRETETIYQIRCPWGDILKKEMEFDMKSIAEEEQEELGSMEFDIDAVITYSNVGTAADFEVPKEALEAEEVDLSDLSEDLEEEE